MPTLQRDGLGLRGVAVALIRCPPHPFPEFRHPAIRPSESAPNISPKQESFASLPPPAINRRVASLNDRAVAVFSLASR
jgi:hypothetical protein